MVTVGHVAAAPDPDALLSFTQLHPLSPDTGDRPMVEVFPDGRVIVFRDRLRRNSGEHAFALDAPALDHLLALARLGVSSAQASTEVEAEARAAAPGAGAVASAIGDPTTSLIGVVPTLGASALSTPPAPGGAASAVAESNESVGLVTLVVRQAASREPGDALPHSMFDVDAETNAVAGAQVSLSAADEPPADIDPLRALELALIELYLLPDAIEGVGR